MTKYVLVQWPESQELMEHPRFNECLFVQDIEGHEEVGSSAYMCPEDLYAEVFAPTEEDFNLYEAMKNMPKEDFLELIKRTLHDK